MNEHFPLELSLSQKIIKNSIYNAFGRFWSILVSLFLTPYIIRQIGVERFGIYTIVNVLTSYFGLLDFGINTSFIKYIAEFYAKKEFGKISRLVNTGFTYYFILGTFIVIVAYFLKSRIITFFNIPPHLYRETVFVFLLGVNIFCCFNVLSVFVTIQIGLQRLDIANKIAIIVSFFYIAGTVFFLEKGYGLIGLMVNNAIIFFIFSIMNIVFAFRLLPELRFNPFLFDKGMFKKLFSFGYKLQIVRVSLIASAHIDKLLIGYFLSISLVTFFHLGNSVVDTVRIIALLSTAALIPAFSEVYAKGESEKMIEGYTRGTKYLSLIALPLFTFIIITAPQIMMVWMGGGYEKSALIIQVLSVGWLFAVLAGMRSVVVMAIAKPEIEMKVGLVALILNILLSMIFIIKFGFFGVGLGTSIALFLSAIYGFIKLHQELRIAFFSFIKATILKAAPICLALGLAIWGIVSMLRVYFSGTNRITNFIILLIEAILFFGIYFQILLFTKPFDNIDITMLLKDSPLFIRNLAMKFSKDEL